MHKCTQHSLIYLYTYLNAQGTRPNIYAQTTQTHDIYRFMLEAFVYKVFVCGLWHQPLCHLFTSWMCIAHMHIHTHPPFSQHTACTQTPMPQTYSCTHKHTCLFHVHHAWKLPTTPGHSPCVDTHVLTLPPAGFWQAELTSTQTSGAGSGLRLSPVIDVQHLSCL